MTQVVSFFLLDLLTTARRPRQLCLAMSLQLPLTTTTVQRPPRVQGEVVSR